MTECIDEGLLRAYLLGDGELPAEERAQIEAHLPRCPACREQMATLRNLSSHVHAKMEAVAPPTAPSSEVAWQKMQASLAQSRADRGTATVQSDMHNEGEPLNTANAGRRPDFAPRPLDLNKQRRNTVQTTYNSRPKVRRAILTSFVAMLALSFAAFPSMQAAAGQILQTFRVQSTTFLPVDTARLSQLQSLDFDTSTLFLSKPQIAAGSMHRTTVASAQEATSAAGFVPEHVGSLPTVPRQVEMSVYSRSNITFTVNVDSLRSILSMLNINDVTLPDALGTQPISANIPPAVVTSYKAEDYSLSLYQGRSPEVSLPAGVDMAQLGKAALRVLGMNSSQADTMSKQIDWSSTLIVPFPTGLSNVKQVQIGDVTGLLVQSSGIKGMGTQAFAPGEHTLLYWQRGDHFYVLDGEGERVQESTMLDAARTVR